jgi:prenyltransferase beta subunit
LHSNGAVKINSDSDALTTDSSPAFIPLPQFNFTRLEKWVIALQGDGYRGRTNKVRDCCYTYWLGSLTSTLGLAPLTHPFGNSYFVSLCENTSRGGFGRDEDQVSEILHTFYAIAGLSILNQLHTAEYGDHSKIKIDPTLAAKDISEMNEAEIEAVKKCKIASSWKQMRKVDPVLGLSARSSQLTQDRPTFQQLLQRYNVAGTTFASSTK